MVGLVAASSGRSSSRRRWRLRGRRRWCWCWRHFRDCWLRCRSGGSSSRRRGLGSRRRRSSFSCGGLDHILHVGCHSHILFGLVGGSGRHRLVGHFHFLGLRGRGSGSRRQEGADLLEEPGDGPGQGRDADLGHRLVQETSTGESCSSSSIGATES